MQKINFFSCLMVISLLVTLSGCAGSSNSNTRSIYKYADLNYKHLSRNQYKPTRVKLSPAFNPYFDNLPGGKGQKLTGSVTGSVVYRYSPDLKFVLAKQATGSVGIFDTDSGEYVSILDMPKSIDSPEFSSFSSNSKYILGKFRQNKAKPWQQVVFDTTTGRKVIELLDDYYWTLFSPDGEHLLILNKKPAKTQDNSRFKKVINTFQLVEIATGKTVFYREIFSGEHQFLFFEGEETNLTQFSGDGKYLYQYGFHFANKDPKTGLNFLPSMFSIDMHTGKVGVFPFELILREKLPYYFNVSEESLLKIQDFIVRDDGKLIFIFEVDARKGIIVVASFDMITQETVFIHELGYINSRVDGYFSSDGKYALFNERRKTQPLSVFDLSAGKFVTAGQPNLLPVKYVFNPKGKALVLSNDSNTVVDYPKGRSAKINMSLDDLIQDTQPEILSDFLQEQKERIRESQQFYGEMYQKKIQFKNYKKKVEAHFKELEERQRREKFNEMFSTLLNTAVTLGVAIVDAEVAKNNASGNMSSGSGGALVACAYNYPVKRCRDAGWQCVPKSQCDPASSTNASGTFGGGSTCNCTSGKSSGGTSSSGGCNGVWKGSNSDIQVKSFCDAACAAKRAGRSRDYKYNCAILRDWGATGKCTVCN